MHILPDDLSIMSALGMLIVAGGIDAVVVKLTRSDESGNLILAMLAVGLTCSALITVRRDTNKK